MSFLAHLFHKEDQKYGSIAVESSALWVISPKIRGKTFGRDPNVRRIIKGIFNLRSSLPKYVTTYDLDIIIRYVDSLPHDTFLLLELSGIWKGKEWESRRFMFEFYCISFWKGLPLVLRPSYQNGSKILSIVKPSVGRRWLRN